MAESFPPFGAGYAKKTGPRDLGERCVMAFRFVLFFGCPSLPLHEPLHFPRAFELLASLRARPIALIARALPFTKNLHFCLPLEAAPPHDIIDGR
jgi:hypothetical protein